MPARFRILTLSIIVVLLSASWASAQNSPPSDQYVPRAEFDRLKAAFDKLQAEVKTIKEAPPAESKGPTPEDYEELSKDVQKALAMADANRHGTTEFLITGDAGVGWTAIRGPGHQDFFNAGFSPLFLWKHGDRLLFEGGLDIGFSNDMVASNGDLESSPVNTEVELSLADLSYIVNDYVTVGAGLFAVPFGIYHPHLDPRWINKLVDDPLAFEDRALGPGTELGAFVTGAAPIESTRINYSAYVTNGPRLETTNPDSVGSLSFDNADDPSFNNKSVGGRIGFLPIPSLEIGYSIKWARVNPKDFNQNIDALLHAVDINFVHDYDAIAGQLTLRAEWIWSDVARATYDPTGALGFGPLTFNNNRNGGYALVAYRPTKVNNKILKNIEFAFRYDRIEAASDVPDGGREQRFAPGIDYWITPSVVVKFEYEFDDNSQGPSHDAEFIQFAIGF